MRLEHLTEQLNMTVAARELTKNQLRIAMEKLERKTEEMNQIQEQLNNLLMQHRDEMNQINRCVVCHEEDRQTVFLPCGHVCMCNGCSKQWVKNAYPKCPECIICREKIEETRIIYLP